jgi:hypothetical protein
MVLLARVQAKKHGAELRIIPGRENVHRIFELTGLVDILPWDSSPDTAPPTGITAAPAPIT